MRVAQQATFLKSSTSPTDLPGAPLREVVHLGKAADLPCVTPQRPSHKTTQTHEEWLDSRTAPYPCAVHLHVQVQPHVVTHSFSHSFTVLHVSQWNTTQTSTATMSVCVRSRSGFSCTTTSPTGQPEVSLCRSGTAGARHRAERSSVTSQNPLSQKTQRHTHAPQESVHVCLTCSTTNTTQAAHAPAHPHVTPTWFHSFIHSFIHSCRERTCHTRSTRHDTRRVASHVCTAASQKALTRNQRVRLQVSPRQGKCLRQREVPPARVRRAPRREH